MQLPGNLHAFVLETGLVERGIPISATPLEGGISSEIWKVEANGRIFCLKAALAELKTPQLWRAPVSRNVTEVAWFETIAKITPNAVPKILAHSSEHYLFAMEYLPPSNHKLWKSELAKGNADPKFSAQVGHTLATIHSQTAHDPQIAQVFDTQAQFHSLRLDPYLLTTAKEHLDLSDNIRALVESLIANSKALVHGDVSPKNILSGPNGPVFLDAETAWYGDPAFDLAFCLNHLLLKCMWLPQSNSGFLECFSAFANAYLNGVDWEEVQSVERRTAALLPALMLARVDGKSPVEYIVLERDKQRIRDFARPRILQPMIDLASIRGAWEEGFK